MKISVRDKDNDLLKPLEIITLKGEDGITPNIQIGTVNTVPPDQEASVVKRGTKEEPIFDFNIPRGASGNSNESGESSSISIDDNTISKDKTWSSSKIEEFVHTNDGAIWSSSHGERLSIDYTKEGKLREVEIWGNTIQNADDLSDIQHLGELHVDDEGKPILDKEGRKQYKIDVESFGKNLFDPKKLYIETNRDRVRYVTKDGRNCIEMRSYEGKAVVLNLFKTPNKNCSISFQCYREKDSNIRLRIGNASFRDAIVTPTTDTWGLMTFVNHVIGEYVIEGSNVAADKKFYIDIDTIQIEENSTATVYTLPQSYTTMLLLPCQLMKAGDVSDRLYWDKEKNKYIIEKNVFKSKFNSSIYQVAILTDNNPNWGIGLYYDTSPLKNKIIKPIFSKILSCTHREAVAQDVSTYAETFGGIVSETCVRIFVKGVHNRREAISIVNNLDMDWWYAAKNPQLIETNITKEILLSSYKDKTHLFVTGGIDGSIKAKAPVDGGKAIQSLNAKNTALSIENEEIKETNIIQDELINTTMLATDEILTVLEPLLVDLLSNTSSSKIIDMYVAMVKRGLKDKDLNEVPLRYREQVKEMIEKEGEM